MKLPGLLPQSGHRNSAGGSQVVGLASRGGGQQNSLASRDKGIVKKQANYKYDVHLKKYNDILNANRQNARLVIFI
jgi:hypothetical protein